MILDLSQSEILGKGRTKTCYTHPLDPSKCVKVVTNPKANPKELRKELRELLRINGRDLPQVFIPQYYGEILTTLGIGHVFDKAASSKGIVYPTFRTFLTDSEQSRDEVLALLQRLRQCLCESGVLFSELSVDNVLILEGQEGVQGKEFAVVDGFGEGSAIKLGEFVPLFAATKTKRKFEVLAQEVEKILQGRGLTK